MTTFSAYIVSNIGRKRLIAGKRSPSPLRVQAQGPHRLPPLPSSRVTSAPCRDRTQVPKLMTSKAAGPRGSQLRAPQWPGSSLSRPQGSPGACAWECSTRHAKGLG